MISQPINVELILAFIRKLKFIIVKEYISLRREQCDPVILLLPIIKNEIWGWGDSYMGKVFSAQT